MEAVERKGKITIECFGLCFSKELPEKVAYAILMDQLPKQREQHDQFANQYPK